MCIVCNAQSLIMAALSACIKEQMRNSTKNVLLKVDLDLISSLLFNLAVEVTNSSVYISEWL